MSNQGEEIRARYGQAEEFEDWYLQRGYYFSCSSGNFFVGEWIK